MKNILRTTPASKETIDNLIRNSGIVVDDLYKALKGELAVRVLMNDTTPSLYILTQDLQNGIKFILMDIGTSCRADLSTSNLYEKRFHLKNIQASISEGYKLLFNFGKLRNRSLWRRLMVEVQHKCNARLIKRGQEIENNLSIFGECKIDKALRDLTLHYNKEMIEVYKTTAAINSEDTIIKNVCELCAILQDILLFTEDVDKYCLGQTGIAKPIITTPIKLNVSNLHKIVGRIINKRGLLNRVFEEFSPAAIKAIDTMATYWEITKRIDSHIHAEFPPN